MSLGYNRLWLTQQKARFKSEGLTWHRTGDVGHLDVDGNLWVEGRVVHIIHTSNGPLTPVPLEISCETIPGVKRAAAVGIGDIGIQQVVIVLETEQGRDDVALAATSAQVREALPHIDVVAVWETKKLPVDIRHNSKIDRTALAKKCRRLFQVSLNEGFSDWCRKFVIGWYRSTTRRAWRRSHLFPTPRISINPSEHHDVRRRYSRPRFGHRSRCGV